MEKRFIDEHGAWLESLPGFLEWYDGLSTADRYRFAHRAVDYWRFMAGVALHTWDKEGQDAKGCK